MIRKRTSLAEPQTRHGLSYKINHDKQGSASAVQTQICGTKSQHKMQCFARKTHVGQTQAALESTCLNRCQVANP
jgi:hypothetical protein